MSTVIKISKHNKCFWGTRTNRETWTNICDIGKIFNGRVLTLERYLFYERKYVNVLEQFFKLLKIERMRASSVEIHPYNNRIVIAEILSNGVLPLQTMNLKEWLSEGEEYPVTLVKLLFILVLREQCWAKFTDEAGNFIHIGYDFFFYLGSRNDRLSQLAIPKCLNYQFLDESPYAEE